MEVENTARRSFLKISGAAVGGSWIVLSLPALLAAGAQAQSAQAEAGPFSVLSPEEASDFAAMAARIVPTDDTPGATEAGVIYFMDNVLGGVSAQSLPALRQGLSDLREAASARFGTRMFSSLPADQQDTLMKGIENSSFFQTVRYLTVAGMFSHPRHGGNANRVGWKLLGFDDRHAWQPPFGYYDAEYAEKGQ